MYYKIGHGTYLLLVSTMTNSNISDSVNSDRHRVFIWAYLMCGRGISNR